jgi:nucleotide-binding universal stress UspA family protein
MWGRIQADQRSLRFGAGARAERQHGNTVEHFPSPYAMLYAFYVFRFFRLDKFIIGINIKANIFRYEIRWSRKKSENAHFRHSRENGNPVFSITLQILDSRLRGNDDFLRNHQIRLPENARKSWERGEVRVEIKKILFATDFSENSRWALKYALSFAQKYEAKLYILHVIQQPSYPLGMYAEISFDAMDKFNRNLSEVTEKEMKQVCQTDLAGFTNYEAMILSGTPFLEIIRTAKEKEADLIVVGTHGRTGLDHVLFGSTAEKVVRKAPCPVVSVRLPGKEFVMP